MILKIKMVNQHFGETCDYHLEGQRICQARNQHKIVASSTSLLLGLLFDPKYEGGNL
jgi:hypothetical protein